MIFGFRYRRIGAFVIDLAIIRMFAQVINEIYYAIVVYLSKGTGVSLSLNDNLALPTTLLNSVIILLIFIGVYVGYHWICFRFLGNSVSRYFLRLQVVTSDGKPVSQGLYLKREFEKVVLCVATVGIYLFFSGAQFVTFGHTPYHDKRNHTKVIEVN